MALVLATRGEPRERGHPPEACAEADPCQWYTQPLNSVAGERDAVRTEGLDLVFKAGTVPVNAPPSTSWCTWTQIYGKQAAFC